MKHLRVLHNGNPLGLYPERLQRTPHWMVCVTEDGAMSGEVLTKAGGRDLPRNFTVSDPSRLFDIPPYLTHYQLEATPHCEEIILTFTEPSGRMKCMFLMSQLSTDSRLRAALEELSRKINEIAEPSNEPNAGLRPRR